MTDNEINARVAERVMGWRSNDTGVVWMCPTKPGETYELNGWAITPPGADAYDDEGDLADPWYRFGGTRVFDVCTDPAAWAALLVWLATQATTQVSLVWTRKPGKEWTASVWWKHKMVVIEDALPGRALALAALRAYGVEG